VHRQNEWVLHVTHLAKRDPEVLKFLRLNGLGLMFQERSDLSIKAYVNWQRERDTREWEGKLTREQRAVAQFGLYESPLSPRVRMGFDTEPVLRHFSKYEGVVPTVLRAVGLELGSSPPRKRWPQLKLQLSRAAAAQGVSVANFANGLLGLIAGAPHATAGQQGPGFRRPLLANRQLRLLSAGRRILRSGGDYLYVHVG
jgi:hypothetical protein